MTLIADVVYSCYSQNNYRYVSLQRKRRSYGSSEKKHWEMKKGNFSRRSVVCFSHCTWPFTYIWLFVVSLHCFFSLLIILLPHRMFLLVRCCLCVCFCLFIFRMLCSNFCQIFWRFDF